MTEKIISLSTYYYNKTEIDNLLKSKIIDASSTNPIDLNTYTTGGFYYCNSDTSKAAYITPLPIPGKSFFLLVEDWGTSNYTKQTLTHWNTNRTFIRIRTNSGGWGNWEELSKTSHVHGNITSDGKIGSDANKPIITTTNGTLTTGSFGTTANTFCQGNDSRLSNARAPTSHLHGNITNDGKIGSDENKPIITTTNGKLIAGAFESSTSNIKMNGPVNVGSLNTFARADHIHPSDTSKSDIYHTHTNLEETSSIPSNSDLNNELYTVAGYYKVKSGESKTLSNRPYPDETYNMAARIEVKVYKNGAYYEYIQFYYTYNDNINIYYRRGHEVDTTTSSYTPLTWGNWKKIVNFEALSTVATSGLYEDLDHLPSIPIANTSNTNIQMDGVQNAGSLDTYAKADHIHPINASIKKEDNLNDYIIPGFYYCTGSTIGRDVLNYPECDSTTLKNSAANGFTLLVEKLNDSSTKQTLTVYNSTNVNPRTFIRIKLANSTGNWNDWKEIEYKGHTHSTNDITGTIATNQIANTAITMDKINSNVYDTTNGGTNGSNKLITSGAVYNGLTNHTHSEYLTSQDISGKEDISNKTSSWNTTVDDTRYPTEKLVKNSLDAKANSDHTHGWINASNDLKYGYGDRHFLYVNEKIRLAYLRFSDCFSAAEAKIYYYPTQTQNYLDNSEGARPMIPTQYLPKVLVTGALNVPYGVLRVNIDGVVSLNLSQGWSYTGGQCKPIYGTVFWHF